MTTKSQWTVKADAEGATVNVAVNLRIVARAPDPVFSYISGPNHCTQPPSYPYAATCGVPDERPPGNFSPPPAGKSYIDPNFGAKVRILAPPRSLHGYAQPTAFSARNQYALVDINGVTTILETATGQIHSRPPVPVEGAMWDAADGEEANSYWTTPRACISPDRVYVIADSNFGLPDRNQVLVIETGYGKTRVVAAPGVVNAANLEPKISPGSYATIFGENLAHCRAASGSPPLPTSLCGTRVSINGLPAPLSFVSPSQVNLIVPGTLEPRKPAPLSVVRGPSPDDTDELPVPASVIADFSPAMFGFAGGEDAVRAIVQYPSGDFNGPVQPMSPGDIGILYLNGLGPTSPAIDDGAPAPQSPLARAVNDVQVLVNDTLQPVQYAGLAPFLARLYQVNFQLDAATPIFPGDGNKIQVRVKENTSAVLRIGLISSAQ